MVDRKKVSTPSNTHLSVKEAAQLVGYTSDYVARLAREGRIISKKENGRRLIDRDSLKMFELASRAEKQRRQEQLRAERLLERDLKNKKSARGVATPDLALPAIPSPYRALAKTAVLCSLMYLIIGGAVRTEGDIAPVVAFIDERAALLRASEGTLHEVHEAYRAIATSPYPSSQFVAVPLVAYVDSQFDVFARAIEQMDYATDVPVAYTIVRLGTHTMVTTARAISVAEDAGIALDRSAGEQAPRMMARILDLPGGAVRTFATIAEATFSFGNSQSQQASVFTAFGDFLCDGFTKPFFTTVLGMCNDQSNIAVVTPSPVEDRTVEEISVSEAPVTTRDVRNVSQNNVSSSAERNSVGATYVTEARFEEGLAQLRAQLGNSWYVPAASPLSATLLSQLSVQILDLAQAIGRLDTRTARQSDSNREDIADSIGDVTVDTAISGTFTLRDITGGILSVDTLGGVSTTTIGAANMADDVLNFVHFADALVVDAATSFDLDTNDADLTFDAGSFFIDAALNRIGLGTTTPGSTVSIVQSANGVPIFSAYRATDSVPSGDFINYMNAAGTSLFRVDNSGSLSASGIVIAGSQTVTATTGPQFRVQYDGSNELTTSISSAGATVLGLNGSAPSLTFTPQSNSVNTFNFTNAASDSIFSIDTNNGRVGLGVSAPTETFEVNGVVRVGTADDVGMINLGDTLTGSGNYTTGIFRGGLGTLTGGGYLNLGAWSGISFSTSGTWLGSQTTRMVIDGTTGNVGIGTTTPGNLLTVAGNIEASNSSGSTFFVNAASRFVGIRTSSPAVPLAVNGATRINGNLTLSANGLTAGNYATLNHDNQDLTLSTTNGTGHIILQPTGNVGIGTTSPASSLQIGGVGATGYASQKIAWGDGTRAGSININSTGSYLYASGDQIFAPGSIERMRITSTGNVGIGEASPAGKLHIYDSSDSKILIEENGGIGRYLTLSYNSGAADIHVHSTDDLRVGLNDGSAYFDIDGDDSAHNIDVLTGTAGRVNVNNALYAIKGGNVGIGTTGPTNKLHVRDGVSGGTAYAGAILTLEDSSETSLQFLSVDGASEYIFFGDESDNDIGGIRYDHSTNALSLRTNNSYPFLINSSGNVGIGTTSPTGALDIYRNGSSPTLNVIGASNNDDPTIQLVGNSSIATEGFKFWYDNSTADTYFDSVYSATSDADIFFRTRTGGTPVDALTIKGTGNVGIGTTTPSARLHVLTTSGWQARFAYDANNYTDVTYSGFNTVGGSQTFSIGGTERMRIDSTGNVGIGTTTPSNKLHIYNAAEAVTLLESSSGAARFTIRPNGAAAQQVNVGVDSDGLFKIANSAGFSTGTKFTINPTSGNVGIGTTTPLTKLHISAGNSGVTSPYAGTNMIIEDDGNNQFSLLAPTNSNSSVIFGNPSSNIKGSIGWVGASDFLSIYSSSVISLNSNVGIGTTSPAATLHVYKSGVSATGNAQAIFGTAAAVTQSNGVNATLEKIEIGGTTVQSDDSGFGGLTLSTNQTGTNNLVGALWFVNSGLGTSEKRLAQISALTDGATNSGALQFATLNAGTYTEKLRITSTGNVGIGTTAPGTTNGGLDIASGGIGLILGADNAASTRTNTTAKYGRLAFSHYTNAEEPFAGFVAGSDGSNNTLSIGGGSGSLNSANILAFYTGATTATLTGTERMRITATGNVGIGTTDPGQKLDVEGTALVGTGSQQARLGTASADGAWVYFMNSALSESFLNYALEQNSFGDTILNAASGRFLGFRVANSDVMRITSTGNVGIGTTGPVSKLTNSDNTGASNDASTFGINQTDGFYWRGVTDVPGYIAVLSNSVATASNRNGLLVKTGATDSGSYIAKFESGGANRLTIRSDGNVGIGTSTPREKLVSTGAVVSTGSMSDIFGNTGAIVDYNGGYARLAGGNSASGATGIKLLTTLSGSYTTPVTIEAGADDNSLYITNSGNIGIGTTSPAALLHLYDNLSDTPSIVLDSGQGAGNGGAMIWRRHNVTKINQYLDSSDNWRMQVGGSDRITVNTSGNVGIGTTTPTEKLSILSADNDGDANVFGVRANNLTAGIGIGYNSIRAIGTNSANDLSIIPKGTGYVWVGGSSVASGVRIKSGNANTIYFGNSFANLTADSGNVIGIGSVTGAGTSGVTTGLNVLTTSGNVGIGTTTPGAKLQVLGTTEQLRLGYDSSNYSSFTVSSAGKLTIAATGGQVLVPDGSVIAGNAPGLAFASYPDTGIAANSQNIAIWESGTLALNLTNTVKEFRVPSDYKFAFSSATNNNSASDTSFYRNSAGVLRTGGSFIADGNVGIGTTSPESLLHVQKDHNGATSIQVGNYNGGGATQATMSLANGSGALDTLTMGTLGTSYSTSGAYIQDTAYIGANSGLSGGLSILTGASAPIRFYTGGTGDANERLRITSTGNVGIGTSTPSTKLHVRADTQNGSLAFAVSNSANSERFRVYDNGAIYATSKLTLQTGDAWDIVPSATSLTFTDTTSGNTPLVLDESGSVGVGTTNPNAKLEVAGAPTTVRASTRPVLVVTDNTTAATSAPLVGINFNTRYFGSNLTDLAFIGGGKENTTDNNYAGYLVFNTRTHGSSDIAERLRITSTGNIGIGTTTPSSKLHVHGGAIYNTNAGGVAGIYLDSDNGDISGDYSSIVTSGAGENLLINRTGGAGIDFRTSSNIRMSILGNGNVGIGTTTPDAKLSVNSGGSSGAIDSSILATFTRADTTGRTAAISVMGGNAGFAGLYLGDSDSGLDGGVIYDNTNRRLGLRSAGTSNQLVIDSSGNVGIGTTSPSGKLAIEYSGSSATSDHGVIVTNTSGNTGALLSLLRDDTTIGLDNVIGRIGFGQNDSSTGGSGQKAFIQALSDSAGGDSTALSFATSDATFSGSATERLRITSSGNVGIGTTTPNQKLVVAGSGDTRMYVTDGIQTGGWLVGASGTADVALGSITNDNLGFLTNGTERMRITTAGNVGIGITTPDQALDVRRGAGIAAYAQFVGNGSPANSLLVGQDASGLSRLFQLGANPITFWTNSLERVRIDSAGNVGIGTTTPSQKFTVGGLGGGNQYFMYGGTGTGYGATGYTTSGAVLEMSDYFGTNPFGVYVDNSGKFQIIKRNGTSGFTMTGSTGNVGIGTTGPGAKLDILADSNSQLHLDTPSGQQYTSAYWQNNGTNKAAVYWDNVSNLFNLYAQNTSSALGLGTNGTEKVRITSTGNVGIGTTSPSRILHVYSTGVNNALFEGISTSATLVGIQNSSTNGRLWQFVSAGQTPTGGEIANLTSGSFSIYDGTSGANRMIITPAGNVGIGTTNPSNKLQVSGGWIQTDTAYGLKFGGDNNLIWGSNTNNYVSIDTNGQQRIRVDSTGNVGIGTTSPSSFKLQVAGNVGPDTDNTYTLGAVGSDWECIYYEGGSLGTCSSDERLKNNIAALTFTDDTATALEKLAAMELHTFTFNDAPDSVYKGLIAQEVLAVAPELVEQGADGFFKVRYGDIQWLLFEAVQELFGQVKAFAQRFVSDEVVANDLLCIGETCIDEATLLEILNEQQLAGVGHASADEGGDTENEDTNTGDTATSTPDGGSETDGDISTSTDDGAGEEQDDDTGTGTDTPDAGEDTTAGTEEGGVDTSENTTDDSDTSDTSSEADTSGDDTEVEQREPTPESEPASEQASAE